MLTYKKVPSLFGDGQYTLKCNVWSDPNFMAGYPDATPEEVREFLGYEPEKPEQGPIAPQPTNPWTNSAAATPSIAADPSATARPKKVKRWKDSNPVPMNHTDSIADNGLKNQLSIFQTPAVKLQTDSLTQSDLASNFGDSSELGFTITNQSSLNGPYNPGVYGATNIVSSNSTRQEGDLQYTSLPIRIVDRLWQRILGYVHTHPTEGTIFSPGDVDTFTKLREANQYERHKRLQDASATMIGPKRTYMLTPADTTQFNAITTETLAKLESKYMKKIKAAGAGADQESSFVATYLLDPEIRGTFNLYRSQRKDGSLGDQFYKLEIEDGNPVWKPVKK